MNTPSRSTNMIPLNLASCVSTSQATPATASSAGVEKVLVVDVSISWCSFFDEADDHDQKLERSADVDGH